MLPLTGGAASRRWRPYKEAQIRALRGTGNAVTPRMNWRRRYGSTLERAIDAIVFGLLIVVAIRAPNTFIRAAVLVAAALVLIGRVIAWRRR